MSLAEMVQESVAPGSDQWRVLQALNNLRFPYCTCSFVAAMWKYYFVHNGIIRLIRVPFQIFLLNSNLSRHKFTLRPFPHSVSVFNEQEMT